MSNPNAVRWFQAKGDHSIVTLNGGDVIGISKITGIVPDAYVEVADAAGTPLEQLLPVIIEPPPEPMMVTRLSSGQQLDPKRLQPPPTCNDPNESEYKEQCRLMEAKEQPPLAGDDWPDDWPVGTIEKLAEECKQLRRERDDWKSNYLEAHQHAEDYMNEGEQLRRERDELLAELQRRRNDGPAIRTLQAENKRLAEELAKAREA